MSTTLNEASKGQVDSELPQISHYGLSMLLAQTSFILAYSSQRGLFHLSCLDR
jgi:hypothetical protein